MQIAIMDPRNLCWGDMKQISKTGNGILGRSCFSVFPLAESNIGDTKLFGSLYLCHALLVSQFTDGGH